MFEQREVYIRADGFNTIFIFEVFNQSLSDEMKGFDSTTMLFLQSVRTVKLVGDQFWDYLIDRKYIDYEFSLARLKDIEKEYLWLITRLKEKNEKCSVAFKFNGSKIVAAGHKESVVHSFMPTNNIISIPIKINGDFSTDPSRTKVVIDDDTRHAIDVCTTIITDLIKEILLQGEDKYGVVDIVKKAKVDPLNQIRGEDINDILVDSLRDKIKKLLKDVIGNGAEIYLQPDGFTNIDFESITNQLSVIGIGNKEEENIPGIRDMLKAFDFKDIPLEKSMEVMKKVEWSEKTRTTVLVDAINESRFGIMPNLKDKITSAKLINFDAGIIPIDKVSDKAIVNPIFEGAIIEALTTPADYISFAKSIGLKADQLPINHQNKDSPVHNIPNSPIQTKIESFSKNRVIKKWRSVEKNVAAVLELMNDVVSVVDVSKQNMGYDIEVDLINGRKRYYEVKSVNGLGDVFSFSNNEYSTAMHYKKDYYFAVTCQDDKQITICFISDPVNSLTLNKRVTRWEWVCSSYEGEVVKANMQ